MDQSYSSSIEKKPGVSLRVHKSQTAHTYYTNSNFSLLIEIVYHNGRPAACSHLVILERKQGRRRLVSYTFRKKLSLLQYSFTTVHTV